MTPYEEVAKYLRWDKSQNCWLLIEPHLLYLVESHAKNYLVLKNNLKYSQFHLDTIDIITQNVATIIGSKNSLTLVDLGPAFPDKALPMGKYCKENGIPLTYVPVDVNKAFLNIACEAMTEVSDSVRAIQAKFEDCLANLPKSQNILVMIGLTFMNFSPKAILPLLKKLKGKSGKALVASEVIAQKNTIDAILKSYEVAEAKNIAFSPLAHLELSQENVYHEVHFKNGRVEMSFILKIPVKIDSKNLKVGDRIITAISHRYSETEFLQTLNSYFPKVDLFWNQDRTTAVGVLA